MLPFFTLHCSFLLNRSLCAKFDSIKRDVQISFSGFFISGVQLTIFSGIRHFCINFFNFIFRNVFCNKNLAIWRRLVFKVCVYYFVSIFYFSLNDSPSKPRKMVFISYKKLFLFSRYSDVCISIFPSFSTCHSLL